MTDAARAQSHRGLYFEQLTNGIRLKSPARTITEADVVAFAGLSGDYNPLHTDAEFAGRGMFGQRIAHGLLGLAVASGLAARLGFLDGTALAFRAVDWKFKRPILLGDTIRVTVEVHSTKPMPALGGGLVDFDVRVLNQRDEVLQQGTWTILVRARPADEEASGP
jgi:3-hydroxybutyryl-CoA dehydratase